MEVEAGTERGGYEDDEEEEYSDEDEDEVSAGVWHFILAF